MARIRSTKPEFWSDRKLATRVSRDGRLLYMAMWNFADEHGRLHGDARYIKGNCLPYDDDITLDDIGRLLGELEAARRIQRYDHDDDPYIYLPKLADHQRLEAEKVPSRLPTPPSLSVTQPDPDPGTGAGADECARRADESAPDPDENALLYVAGSRGQVAGGRGAALARRTHEPEPVDDPTGRLLAEHVNAYQQPPPQTAQAKVKVEIMRLVAERVEPDRIRAGLTKLRERQLAASLLPQLVTEVTPTRNGGRSGGDRNSQILAGARARAEAAEAQQPARRALP